jgi:hypothetical protein
LRPNLSLPTLAIGVLVGLSLKTADKHIAIVEFAVAMLIIALRMLPKVYIQYYTRRTDILPMECHEALYQLGFRFIKLVDGSAIYSVPIGYRVQITGINEWDDATGFRPTLTISDRSNHAIAYVIKKELQMA